MQRYTVTDFDRDFPNDDACLEWLRNHLYPDGIFCKTCDRITKHHKIATRRSYSCDVCGHHVHPTTGTIFEKSTTSLKLWFHAIFLISSTRCGISAKQIERETGVTYKTAWRMYKEIRTLLNEDTDPFTGHVEVDETYIGGKRHGKRGRGAAGKTAVVGAVQRKGKVVTHVQDCSRPDNYFLTLRLTFCKTFSKSSRLNGGPLSGEGLLKNSVLDCLLSWPSMQPKRLRSLLASSQSSVV